LKIRGPRPKMWRQKPERRQHEAAAVASLGE
jgi:hypothetical protein